MNRLVTVRWGSTTHVRSVLGVWTKVSEKWTNKKNEERDLDTEMLGRPRYVEGENKDSGSDVLDNLERTPENLKLGTGQKSI